MKSRTSLSDTKNLMIPETEMTQGSTKLLRMMVALFYLMPDDVVQNILSRLPALDFASAACVNKQWNRICSRIISRPKIASAVSFLSSAQVAVSQVIRRVLAEPIRPHFVIVNFTIQYILEDIIQLIGSKLGSTTPLIITHASGIMGTDALTKQFKEEGREYCVGLTVGYVPGLRVEVIPLKRSTKGRKELLVNRFIRDVKDYTSSVSNTKTPVGIMMFRDKLFDMRPLLNALNYEMPTEIVIVGNHRGDHFYRMDEYFFFRSTDESRNAARENNLLPAAALVFVKDKNKPSDIGDIKFHVALSKGVSTIGPRHTVVSVGGKRSPPSSLLTATREGDPLVLNGAEIFTAIDNEMEMVLGRRRISSLHFIPTGSDPNLYIGVTKRRNLSRSTQKPRWVTSLDFHGSKGTYRGNDFLHVKGGGIKAGDDFQFYRTDTKAALSSCEDISQSLKKLKLDGNSKEGNRNQVFGCFVFSSYCRDDLFFFPHSIAESAPFLDNFPGVPLTGMFCADEIGCGSSSRLVGEGDQNESDDAGPCRVHVQSTVYLALSYTPAP